MTAPVLEPGATALSASGLRIGYGGKTVVDNISLTIDRREIVCLLGGSGCGKSTLLRGLAGLSPAQAGQVSFLGEPLLAPHPRAALVFQQPSLLPWLSVEGNVGFGLDFARQPAISRDARKQRVVDAIEAVVTTCAAAIAETGTIVLDHTAGQGRRALTLVPDLHVCLVRADQIHADVPAAVGALRASVEAGHPLTWISGPSATSDIELDRVEGVHGPRRLHVIVTTD